MSAANRAIACSSCFKNFGLALEARKVGNSSPSECPRCKSTNGAKLGKDQLWTLQNNFFIWGSSPTTYYPSPIGLAGAELRAAEFEANTWEDYLLLQMLTPVKLFWYGPALYRFGMSLLREKIQARLKPDQHEWPLSVDQKTTIDDLWRDVTSIVRPIVLNVGTRIFRARMAPVNAHSAS